MTPLMVLIVLIGVFPRPFLNQIRPAVARLNQNVQAQLAEAVILKNGEPAAGPVQAPRGRGGGGAAPQEEERGPKAKAKAKAKATQRPPKLHPRAPPRQPRKPLNHDSAHPAGCQSRTEEKRREAP